MEIVFSDESGRSNVARVIDATVGNDVLQLRYLTPGPITGMKTNLDYGVLLTEDREFIASTALMFDTDLHVSGFAVFGSGFYSPGVLPFGSAHNLYDFTAGAELRFMPRLVGLAGYRCTHGTKESRDDPTRARQGR